MLRPRPSRLVINLHKYFNNSNDINNSIYATETLCREFLKQSCKARGNFPEDNSSEETSELSFGQILQPKTLLKFAFQISQGMSYLSDLKVRVLSFIYSCASRGSKVMEINVVVKLL